MKTAEEIEKNKQDITEEEMCGEGTTPDYLKGYLAALDWVLR